MKRNLSFDILRIIAAYGVVLCHASVQFYNESFPSLEWIARTVYDGMVRWCVPVFVMISGSLFLNTSKILDVRKLYLHNIFRIVFAFLLWTIVYSTYDSLDIGLGNKNWPDHLWFLEMLIGLYVVIPILRMVVMEKKTEEYFLGVAWITTFFFPLLSLFVQQFDEKMFNQMNFVFNSLGVNIASGFTGYFVLGHYLCTYHKNNPTHKQIIYVLGVTSFFVVTCLTCLYSYFKGEPSPGLFDYLNPFTLFEAAAVFLFVIDCGNKNILPRKEGTILKASRYSFGIYLIHMLVIRLLNDMFSFDSSYFNSSYFIPIYSLLVFMISYCIIDVFVRIPIVNKTI